MGDLGSIPGLGRSPGEGKGYPLQYSDLENLMHCIDITLLTKVRLVKAMVFPVVMYGYESWTIKKAEHQRIDTKILESPLDYKEIQEVHPKAN